jgi:hypothetical protein
MKVLLDTWIRIQYGNLYECGTRMEEKTQDFWWWYWLQYLMMQTFDDDIDCLMMILMKIFTNGLNQVLQWWRPVIKQVYDGDSLHRFQLIAEGETVTQLHLKIGKLTESLEKLIRYRYQHSTF